MKSPTISYWRALSGALIFGHGPVVAGTPEVAGFTETTFANLGTNIFATGLAWAPDDSGRLFVMRKGGVVRIIKNGAVLPTPFATITPVYTNSECGLIGMAFDPNFLVNQYVYFFVTVSANEQQIIRYTATGDVGLNKTIIKGGLSTLGQNHDGGGMAFGYDGKLYWSIGDGGNNTGVDSSLTTSFAKVGRSNPDGSAPVDNPFYLGNGTAQDWTWARGFRNPFTMTVQPGSGILALNVVGSTSGGQTNPNSGPGYEQFFFVSRGSDGGYDDWEGNQNLQPGGIRYAGSPLLFPVLQYKTNGSDATYNAVIPASGITRTGNLVTFTTAAAHKLRRSETINLAGSTGGFDGRYVIQSVPGTTSFTAAGVGPDGTGGGGTVSPVNLGGSIGGGAFYDSTAFPSEYRGNFFFADYNSGQIMRVALDASNRAAQAGIFLTGSTSVIDVAQGADGALYYLGAGSSGAVYRLGAAASAQEVLLSSLHLNLVEGGQGMLSLRLAIAPSNDVVVQLDQPERNLIFTPANWNVPQTVTIPVPVDADFDPTIKVLQLVAPGIGTYALRINASDPDVPNLVISQAAISLTEGSTGTFTVRLASAPAGPVDVSVAPTSADPSVTVSGGASLSFTPQNFSTPQTVTLSAPEDADTADGFVGFTVTGPGLGSRTVSATAVDNDTAAPLISSIALTTAVVGANYRSTVVASGRPAPTFSLTTAPAGMTINSTTGLILWTPSTSGTFAVQVRAANLSPPAAVQSFNVAVSPDLPPAASLTSPGQGQILTGSNAEFFGDGNDDVGCVKADFSIDGVAQPAASDFNPSGHYHFNREHLGFDTTALGNGPHLLRFTVTDTKGQTSFQEADIIVSNAPSPAAAWRFQYFTPAQLREGIDTADSADPDSDGISNKLERFLNMNPTVSSQSGLPWGAPTGDGRLGIVFDRALAALDLPYVVEVSPDLATWFSGPNYTEVIAEVEQGGTRRITSAARSGPGLPVFRFIHLRIP